MGLQGRSQSKATEQIAIKMPQFRVLPEGTGKTHGAIVSWKDVSWLDLNWNKASSHKKERIGGDVARHSVIIDC